MSTPPPMSRALLVSTSSFKAWTAWRRVTAIPPWLGREATRMGTARCTPLALPATAPSAWRHPRRVLYNCDRSRGSE
jgi:hypothetical protein